MSAFAALVVKDIKQLLRDPKTMVMVMFMPILVMAMFVAGYGGKGGEAPIAVVNLDNSPVSWQLIDVLRNLGSFKIAYFASTASKATELVASGKAYAAIVIPKGFGEKLLMGGRASLEVILDASYAAISEMVWDAVIVAVQKFQVKLAESHGTPAIDLIRTTVYGPKVTRVDNFLGTVMGILLCLVPMTLISVSVSRERERMTFEQLIMTPIRSRDIILGKLTAYAALTLADTVVTLWVAVNFFNVVIRGSFADILVVSALELLNSLSIGLLISVVSRNQLQAYQTAVFFFIPFMLFSGFFTPVELLSPTTQMIGRLMPLYYFLRAFRDIQLRGWALADCAGDVLMLAGQTLFFLALSIKLLRLKVE